MSWIQKYKKEVIETLKKEFPNYKFSVTAPEHNSLKVAIMKSDLFENGEECSVNHYWIKENYQSEQKDFLLKVKEIADNRLRVIDENPDYGSIPNFYLDISIGKWNKPHETIAT